MVKFFFLKEGNAVVQGPEALHGWVWLHNWILDHNALLSTLVYEVKFPDGAVKEYAANVIAENILRTVDRDNYHNVYNIIHHKRDESVVKIEEKFTISRND